MHTERKYLPQLDGLRGIAILLVVLCHARLSFSALPFTQQMQAGWIGVDLFFVLSGFLITRILIETRGSERYYLNFYARRGLRIWPLYYLVLAFLFLVGARGPLRYVNDWSFWVYAFYLQNLVYGRWAGVTWSLAVEEHFYFLWPVVVAKIKSSVLPKLLIGVILAEAVARSVLLPRLGDYSWTFYRLDELAFGALLASWMASSSFAKARGSQLKWALLILSFGCGLAAVLTYRFIETTGLQYTLLGCGFAAFIGFAVMAPGQSLARRFLENRFLRYTGKVSYGMYLYHGIILEIFWQTRLWVLIKHLSSALLRDSAAFLVEFGMIYAIATISWYSFEQPLLRLKSYFGPTFRSAAVLASQPAGQQLGSGATAGAP